ncbi:MAG: universal stress protein [Chloroflexi bacterium]|nr:universal stress protein [Chloroflexota bacterium]
MYKRILVPLDGSSLAENALTQAKNVCEQTSEIVLLQVIHLPVPIMTPDLNMSLPAIDSEELRAEALSYLQSVADQLTAEGLQVSVDVVEEDNVADAIIDYAKEHSIDLIVQSTHGRGGFSRLVFGSVSEDVLRKTPCPVMFIRS